MRSQISTKICLQRSSTASERYCSCWNLRYCPLTEACCSEICRNAKNDEKEHVHKHFFEAYFALPFILTSKNPPLAMATTITSPPIQGNKPGFSLLDPIPPPSGRDLFIAENKATINEAAKLEHKKCGVNHHYHAAIFQFKSKEFFDAMSSAKKEEWNKQARKMEVGQDIYQWVYFLLHQWHFHLLVRNQLWLAYEMTCTLNSLIGNGPCQISNASLTLFFGYQDKNENIQLGRYVVINLSRFQQFEINYLCQCFVSNRWLCSFQWWRDMRQYCGKLGELHQIYPMYVFNFLNWIIQPEHALDNRSPERKKANVHQFPATTPPVFPDFSDATPVEELRTMVKEFLELQWGE